MHCKPFICQQISRESSSCVFISFLMRAGPFVGGYMFPKTKATGVSCASAGVVAAGQYGSSGVSPNYHMCRFSQSNWCIMCFFLCAGGCWPIWFVWCFTELPCAGFALGLLLDEAQNFVDQLQGPLRSQFRLVIQMQ